MKQSEEFLDILEGLIQKKIKNPYSLGRVDPSYSSGKPKIIFDGETVASGKTYSYLSSYTPSANDRVLLVNIANTHVILGKIV